MSVELMEPVDVGPVPDDVAVTTPTQPSFMQEDNQKPAEDAGPQPMFLSDTWDDDDDPVEPTLVPVIGGKPLLYEGESHMIYGAGGSGKTWLADYCILQVVRSGRIALLVDYESNARTHIQRLKALGGTKDDASRIAYWAFSDTLMPRTETGNAFSAWVDKWRPGLVIIDSVSRALATAGFNENENSDFNLWDAGVTAKLTARRVTSLIIDHTGHQGEFQRGPANARGASSKVQRLSGASYLFEVVKPWTRENSGLAKLTCMKDREGHRKQGGLACEMHVTVANHGLQVDIELREPERTESGETKLTEYWDAITDVLTGAEEPMSGNQLNKALEDRGLKSAKRVAAGAVKQMVQAGLVVVEPGPRASHLHTLVRDYRDTAAKHAAADVHGF